MTIQTITSAQTSQKQVPALAKRIDWVQGQTCLDLGGGKYDLTTEYLWRVEGVRNYIVDPYNRSIEHNVNALMELDAQGGADVCMLANVLNVIREPEIRQGVLQQAYANLKPGGRLYVSCYPGSLSRVGGPSKRGWQENRPIGTYLSEVLAIFEDAYLRNGIIVAPKRFR